MKLCKITSAKLYDSKNVIYNKVPNLDSYTLQELLPVAHFHSAAHYQPVATKENMRNN